MLTQLSTVKTRLAVTVTDYDAILTAAINGLFARFDKETNRTLARTTAITEEFPADQAEPGVLPPGSPANETLQKCNVLPLIFIISDFSHC